MKTFLFFFLISNFAVAQNADLLNTNWKITKIITELAPTDLLPPPTPNPQVTRFTGNSFTSSFFNTASGNLTYTGQDSFTVNNKTCTNTNYTADDGEVNQFFKFICDFFDTQSIFYYNIQNNGSEKILRIDTGIFQTIYFTSGNLSAKDNNFSHFILWPNPVKNSLNIQNSDGIKSAELFDISGKLVYKMDKKSATIVNIDLHNLKTGTYFIKLNDEKTYKIIKE